jgi:hypothetical protein
MHAGFAVVKAAVQTKMESKFWNFTSTNIIRKYLGQILEQ